MKKMCLLLAFCMLSVMTAACAANKDNNPPSEQAAAKTPTETATELPADVEPSASLYPMTVVDSYGNEIVIEKEPQTIISIAPNITETLYALGLQGKLVGRSDYCDYPPEVQDIASIGDLQTPDIEHIVELNPDLIMGSAHFTEETMQTLSDMGLTVLALYEDESFDGAYTLVEKIGHVFNQDEAAAAIVSDMKNTVSEVVQKVDGLEKPTVYYMVGFGEYGDFTAGGDTFVGQMITMAGGDNIAQQVNGWSYNIENLLEADPEIIIVSQYYDMKAGFISAEGYKDLTAVKEGRVYEIDENPFNRQGVRNAEGLRMLAEIFHPDAFR